MLGVPKFIILANTSLFEHFTSVGVVQVRTHRYDWLHIPIYSNLKIF